MSCYANIILGMAFILLNILLETIYAGCIASENET